MSFYKGDYLAGSVVRFLWNTYAVAGESITRATNGSILIYKNNSATQRSSSAGITDTEDFDALTGVHLCNIDLSDNTDSGFYAAGNDYSVVLQAATIDGKVINSVLAQFSIENRSGTALATAIATALAAILAVKVKTDFLPSAAAGGNGGVPLVDANNAVKLQSGTGANQIDLTAGLVNIGKINNDEQAAVRLALAAKAMIFLTVNASEFSPTLTQVEFTELSEATPSHYYKRPILFLTGPLAGQARAITAYTKIGTYGRITVDTLTDLPANGNFALML